MKQVFTDYVRSLPPSGDPPDVRSYEEVWKALGQVVRSEIRKRGLWDSPPSYLGVYGWESWSSAAPGSQSAPALEDLLAECYSYIFVRRLDSLKVQLKVKPNIDGLVFLNVRNYLHDTQKQHDPLGFRIFEILRAAIREAVSTGEIHVLAGDPRIRNDTVLGTSARADPNLPAIELDGIVSSWSDTLLPELVTARGKARERVVAGLLSALLRLPADGVEVFRFGPLIDALKNDVRTRWGLFMDCPGRETAFDETEGKLVTLVRQSVEERDSFRALTACLAEAMDRVEPIRTRGYLSTLWEFLRAYAAEPDDAGTASPHGGTPPPYGDELPSGRRLARLLRIPRDRLPDLFSTLRRFVEDCQASTAGRAAVDSPWFGQGARQPRDQPDSRRAP